MTSPPNDTQTDSARAERFYAEVWPEAAMLMRTAISLTPSLGNPTEAEDLVQETLLKAFKAIDRLEPGTSPKAWLLTMLRRTWIDRWRKQERRPDGHAVGLDNAAEPEAEAASAGESDVEWTDPQALMSRFDDQDIIDALRLLPEGYRWALLLVDVQSLSVEEAAETLEVAAGTVKSRLHRGRAMLRDRLHGYAAERGWLRGRADAVQKGKGDE